jgi:hypothetical protein
MEMPKMLNFVDKNVIYWSMKIVDQEHVFL